MKKYLILILLSLLSNLSEIIGELIENNSVSKLISLIRMEIVDKSLSDLPRRKEVNVLKMVSKMVNAKKEYSLNEAESAYLVFKWISQNIDINFYDEDLDEPIKAYDSGKGTPKALSSLFNNICTFLKVTSDSISGYLKWTNYRNYEIQINRNYTWNYIEIEGEYYLLDVSMAAELKYHSPKFFYLYFSTEPEIFIRSHFPNESKWQLLSEPYTFEKFESMALLTPFFYLLGFKAISPDTTKINGNERIILTSEDLIPKLDFAYSCSGEDIDDGMIYDDYFDGTPDNKLEVEFEMDECSIYGIELVPKNSNIYEPLVYYKKNPL